MGWAVFNAGIDEYLTKIPTNETTDVSISKILFYLY